MASSQPSSFSVRRREAILLPPAKPTPYQLKPLSDIDDQQGLRFEMPVVFFYCGNDPLLSSGRDPVAVIRDAVAKALVHYYPFAGRIREGSGRKLTVECTGEGIVFVEADANFFLEDLGDSLPPPPPLVDEFFCRVAEGSEGSIIDRPLLFIQVTRLMCGGFVFSVRFSHVMTDAYGLMLFMNAIADIARGAERPAVPPVWARELLSARTLPRVTYEHREYDEEKAIVLPPLMNDEVHRWFLFGQREMAGLRKHVPPHLRKGSSAFELLAACLWRCRTVALGKEDSAEEVRLICVVNTRGKFRSPPLPAGYYGNALAFPVALSTAEMLCRNPLTYAVELVRKLKSVVTEEYMRSVADLMVLRGRPPAKLEGGFLVSDTTRANIEELDFGWGSMVCGGVGAIPGFSSFFVRAKNGGGTMVPIVLPRDAMERFAMEIQRITTEPVVVDGDQSIMAYGFSRL